MLKALGDNTRYAIYLELARSPSPPSTADIAETLGLHPNTVRPHLERMRDVGLLDVETDDRGIGRPAPAPLRAGRRRPLARPGAARLPAAGPHARRAWPPPPASSPTTRPRPAPSTGRAMADATPAAGARAGLPGGRHRHALDELGFDPAVVQRRRRWPPSPSPTAPIAELAEAHPEVVCHLHRGLIEGFVEPNRRRRR